MESYKYGTEGWIFGTEQLKEGWFFAKITVEVNRMQYKIVVITSHYLHKPTQESLRRVSPDCEYIVVPYDNFEHIVEVYDRYAAEADGFLISGKSALSAIQMNTRETLKPMVPFQVDTAALYKELLHLVLKNRQQDLRRVVMDALLPIEGGYTAADFLEIAEIDSVDVHITNWIRQSNTGGLGGVEQEIAEKLIELWESGTIDMVICQYSSVIPTLEEHGIPYRYPFLSDFHLGECVKELLVKIELENLRAGLPAAVCVSPRQPSAASEHQLEQLKEALHKFLREHLMNCEIRHEGATCYVDLTVQNIRYFTQNSVSCILRAFLVETLDFETVVGYGIGSSREQAASNAVAALKEASLNGKSFIRDEAGNLIGPLDSERQMVVSTRPMGDVGEIARRCSLSTMTIRKLMTHIRMTGTNKTTTQELSQRFDVTIRNANRILSNLEKGGCARIIYSQTSSTKGRPVKVYELNFDQ